MFKKNPENIIIGTIKGADRLIAAFVDGAAADKNVPKETAACATSTIIPTQMKNLPISLFKLLIQYTIEIRIVGDIMKFGSYRILGNH